MINRQIARTAPVLRVYSPEDLNDLRGTCLVVPVRPSPARATSFPFALR